MVTVGVDLHQQTSQIAVLRDEGRLTQRRLANASDPAWPVLSWPAARPCGH